MADGGVGDSLITFNIFGAVKLERLKALSRQVEKLAVTADNATIIEGLCSALTDELTPLDVLDRVQHRSQPVRRPVSQ